MPTYEYKCSACEHRFELRQSFDADTVTDCPECGKTAKRQISLVPVIFKGSGWYVNDYSRKNSTLSDDSSKDSEGSKTKETSGDKPKDQAKDSKQESKPKEESKT
jgi:putative FmdB family regulatory protein